MELRQRMYLYVFLILGIGFIIIGIVLKEMDLLRKPFETLDSFEKILKPYLSGFPKPWEETPE